MTSWWQIWGVLLVAATSLNESTAFPGDELALAIVEAPPRIATLISCPEGRLFVGGEESKVLRHFRVQIVEREELDLSAAADLPAGTAFLLQLKPAQFDIGMNALPVLSEELSKALLGRKFIPAKDVLESKEQYRYSAGWVLDLRVSIPGGARSYADEFRSAFHDRLGTQEFPDEDAKTRALSKTLGRLDEILRQEMGVRMLKVQRCDKGSRNLFCVEVENVYPFPVKGSIRFPEEEGYRVDVSQRSFHLVSGGIAKLKFQLEPTDPSANELAPAWISGLRDEYYVFGFPELVLNAPTRE